MNWLKEIFQKYSATYDKKKKKKKTQNKVVKSLFSFFFFIKKIENLYKIFFKNKENH